MINILSIIYQSMQLLIFGGVLFTTLLHSGKKKMLNQPGASILTGLHRKFLVE